MICVTALLVSSILGIFSATHRKIALDAWDCVTSRAMRQPCDTGLDDRLQASIVGKTLNYSPRTARLLQNHFEAFSWIFLILLIASGLTAGAGVYNWAVHGNCNGPDSDKGCELNKLESQFNYTTSEQNDTINETSIEVEQPKGVET
jgi:hypothetical protein